MSPDTGPQSAAEAPAPGRLAFADMKEFEAYLTPLLDASTAELEAAEKQKGLHSLRAYLDAGEETEEGARAAEATGSTGGSAETAYRTDGVARRDFVVGDAFLSVLNSRGEVQIGDSIYKVTRDNVYAVALDSLDVLNRKVPTLGSPAPADRDPAIAVHPVETTFPPAESEADQPASAATGTASRHVIAGVGPNCYVNATSTRRMHGQVYISNYWLFSQAGVRTEWQRRIFWFFWVNNWQSGTLSHKYDARLYRNWLYIGPGAGSQSGTGTAQIHTSLAFSFWGATLSGHIHGYHSFSNNYGSGSCQTAW